MLDRPPGIPRRRIPGLAPPAALRHSARVETGTVVLITPWMFAGQVLGMAAQGVAWFRGGHAERFAAGVLLFGNLVSSITFRWKIGGVYVASILQEVVVMAIFVALAQRSNRWWPFMAAALMVLVVLANAAPLLSPGLSNRDVSSAQIGLWFFIDATLLLSVIERWLAGERPVSAMRWEAVGARRP